MALIVIVHDFAHRLLDNGILESTPVEISKAGSYIVKNDWEPRSGNQMEMTGAEVAMLQDDLRKYSLVFHEGYRLPRTTVQNPEPVEGVAPV